jgi:MFS family permease
VIRNRLLITLAKFAAVGCMGLSVSFLGPSLPLLRDFLRRDFEGAGLFTAGIQFGYALMGAVGGVLADRFRGDRVLTGGCLFPGAGSPL